MRLATLLHTLPCFVIALPVFGSEKNPPAAKDVLEQMAKKYAGCKSYRDSGVVKTIYIDATGRKTEETPFKTAFVRPDRMRFEFVNKMDKADRRYIVWRNGDRVRRWWDVEPGVVTESSLDFALFGVTGISGGTSLTVSMMLLPKEVKGLRLTELKDAKLIDDAKTGGMDCFRVEGGYGDSHRTVWIDKTSFLLRRIDAQALFTGFRTEETATYNPAIDVEIPDNLLEFNHPKK